MSGQSIQWNFQSSGDSSKHALLFLHGFMGSSLDWQDIADCFAEKYGIIALDLPGHGQTVATTDDDYTMPRCASGIVDLLHDLNITRTHLIGYSMGGRLALYLATHYPKLVDKVIVESASPGLKTQQERSARVEHDLQIARDITTLPMAEFLARWYDQPLFATVDKNGPPFQSLMRRCLLNDSALLAKSLRHMGTGAQPSLWSDLPKIRSQLLLIVGGQDAKFKSIAEEIAEIRPATKIVVIPDAGHNVHMENPLEYIKQVSLFLKS
ncbi:MAG: 2-succinyl-6-hydroxy-2,4-cyclohexadiene-1-carboxylate synthase [Candidatus Zixiibacteriota bacterium]